METTNTRKAIERAMKIMYVKAKRFDNYWYGVERFWWAAKNIGRSVIVLYCPALRSLRARWQHVPSVLAFSFIWRNNCFVLHIFYFCKQLIWLEESIRKVLTWFCILWTFCMLNYLFCSFNASFINFSSV